jgi:hypothetical protein
MTKYSEMNGRMYLYFLNSTCSHVQQNIIFICICDAQFPTANINSNDGALNEAHYGTVIFTDATRPALYRLISKADSPVPLSCLLAQ